MPYRAPVGEYEFILDHVVDYALISETETFADAQSDVVSAILGEAGKLCDEVIAPVNRNGDLHPAVLENGKVRSSPGYAEAYGAIAEGGWVGLAASPEYGGMGLPMALGTSVNEMMGAASLALQLNPLLTQGQIEALEHHASEELRALYLPKLISGEWNGTMNLTEPHAGSDVGALSTKAEPNGDGTYAITGQKIFITWGDSDVNENTCHLVLARLPDATPGTKGISLFLVPKLIPDADGKPGVANTLRVASLEHKLGLHGSPTAVMQFEGATGWLVGEPNKGMAAMFTMMNNARLGVGVQGVGVAEAAYQQAVEFAMERKQGRVGGSGTIIEHADVRRMLATMKADVFASRAIALACAAAIDMAKATGHEDWAARAALLTPIAKSFGTDTGMAVASLGVQVHGGMGFIEETGAAQFMRDVRVTAIYEGTNGIQAMDLVSRKLMDGGAALYRLLDEVEALAETGRASLPELAADVWEAAESVREAAERLVAIDLQDRFAGAVPFQTALARLLGGYYHLKAALAEGGDGQRTALARFYIKRMLPECESQLKHALAGAEDLYAITNEALLA